MEFRTDPQWFTDYYRRGGSSDGPIERLDDVAMDEVRLATPVGGADIARLKLGDVVYLDGFVYTARGVYHRSSSRDETCPTACGA